MPISGGTSDKLGNAYEGLWIIHSLLCIVSGEASSILIEAMDETESRGIEFILTKPQGIREYWSVKRQTSQAAGWTLNLLLKQFGKGRSILNDLINHICSDNEYGVFASTQDASDLREFCDFASKDLLDERLKRSVELNAKYVNYILPLSKGDPVILNHYLNHIIVKTVDEGSLRDSVDTFIKTYFYNISSKPVDPVAVRGILAELILDKFHQDIYPDDILSMLDKHGYRRRDWSNDRTTLEHLEIIKRQYIEPIQNQLILGRLFPLIDMATFRFDDTGAKRILVVGTAGSGKSSSFLLIIEELNRLRMPVLPIRFDQLAEGLLSTNELGQKMGLPESPVLVLAGIANGGPCAFLIDQLDAISETSGRRTESWSLFEKIAQEINQFPNMHLIVGCREYDLENDRRLRRLKSQHNNFIHIRTSFLSDDQVASILKYIGVDYTRIAPALENILTLPLHMSMYLEITNCLDKDIKTIDQLFDEYWDSKRRSIRSRLGNDSGWPFVINALCTWLSCHQTLSAPKEILDQYQEAADTLTSEHVLVLGESKYRFFHESFFDYAFARYFISCGESMIDLLVSTEQHLFRRAQVRQILIYLRGHHHSSYHSELKLILTSDRVRFHIQKHVILWLGSLDDPTQEEWNLLREIIQSRPRLRTHILNTLTAKSVWFDLMVSGGYIDSLLSSGISDQETTAIMILGRYNLLEVRSPQIAAILAKYRKDTQEWKKYLQYISRMCSMHHSREMFDLFISLIKDGTLDDVHPGIAVNDDWWCLLNPMCNEAPEYACEAIGHWLDRIVERGKQEGEEWLRDTLNYYGQSHYPIRNASEKAHRTFVEQLLPRIAAIVADHTISHSHRLNDDIIWGVRCYGDEPFSVSGQLLEYTAEGLVRIAKESSGDLNRLLVNLHKSPHETIAYLILRAWTAGGEQYADEIAEYLIEDTRRLNVGYDIGAAPNYISIEALKLAARSCTNENHHNLERSILSMRFHRDDGKPRYRGYTKLELLSNMDESRLSTNGLNTLRELQHKFPNMEIREPSTMKFRRVGPPIPEDSIKKMNNKQWLNAMKKYAGVEHMWDRRNENTGGEQQLADALYNEVLIDPNRYLALSEEMPDEYPASYFKAIVRGVADSQKKSDNATPTVSTTQVEQLIRRIHRISERPCGEEVARLIQKWPVCEWTDETQDILVWYAIHDVDPKEELWQKSSQRGDYYYGGDPYMNGYNSTRGVAAEAIARILFDRPDRLANLKKSINVIIQDPSTAVRSCAAEILLAMLNIDRNQAIVWFKELIKCDDAILSTHCIFQFLKHTVAREYSFINCVLQRMLSSENQKARDIAAKMICLADLDSIDANEDAKNIRSGSDEMRVAAANVYATNVSNSTVGPQCLEYLLPLLSDSSISVRLEASLAMDHLSEIDTISQSKLLTAFIAGDPALDALERAIRALEESPVQLPDLVCAIIEKCIDLIKNDGGDFRTSAVSYASDISKIIVRLYAQTADIAIQTRCLNAIDRMEEYNFYGLDNELKALDR